MRCCRHNRLQQKQQGLQTLLQMHLMTLAS
jgi:hypothetical protein